MVEKLKYPGSSLLIAIALVLIPSTLFSQEGQKINILHSDYMEYDKNLGSGVVKYVGKVAFQQEDVFLYCDSAYLFAENNYVNAYNNIHVVQGDTLHLYGDLLRYYGNTKIAEVRRNVTLIDKETTLTTESLDFNLDSNAGYYEQHGHVINGDNILDSRAGYYYSKSKHMYFIDSVVIVNPDYTIYADTLRYNTDSEIAHFLGPTQIISPENYLYCEDGWYDTKKDVSQLNKNVYMVSKGQVISGDSLYYERETGMGLASDNVQVYDSAQDILLRSKFALYYEDTEYTLLTDSAVFIQISGEDSLFLHADTILSELDTSGQFKIIKAWYRVKFFRENMQGKCDSLVYIESDSVFYLQGEPVMWSEEHQLTAERIDLHMALEKPDYFVMTSAAFIISQDDSTSYNQIKGRDMTGYFKDSQLDHIEVAGNGQSVYFARDSLDLIGVNTGTSSDMLIQLLDGQIEKIMMLGGPTAVLHPPGQITEEDLFLSGFIWLDQYRPKRKEEIFIWVED